jgi:hypothetical protein
MDVEQLLFVIASEAWQSLPGNNVCLFSLSLRAEGVAIPYL